MKTITRTMPSVNLDKLDEVLKTALPGKYQGASRAAQEVTLYFADETTDQEIQDARVQWVETHNAAVLTDAQTLRQWVKNLPVTYSTDPSTITNAQVQKATLALILFLKAQL